MRSWTVREARTSPCPQDEAFRSILRSKLVEKEPERRAVVSKTDNEMSPSEIVANRRHKGDHVIVALIVTSQYGTWYSRRSPWSARSINGPRNRLFEAVNFSHFQLNKQGPSPRRLIAVNQQGSWKPIPHRLIGLCFSNFWSFLEERPGGESTKVNECNYIYPKCNYIWKIAALFKPQRGKCIYIQI